MLLHRPGSGPAALPSNLLLSHPDTGSGESLKQTGIGGIREILTSWQEAQTLAIYKTGQVACILQPKPQEKANS